MHGCIGSLTFLASSSIVEQKTDERKIRDTGLGCVALVYGKKRKLDNPQPLANQVLELAGTQFRPKPQGRLIQILFPSARN